MFKENMKLNMKEDMINDIIDNICEGINDSEEEEKIYNTVLKDVGFKIEEDLPSLIKNDNKKQNDLIEDEKLDNLLKSLQK